MRGGGVVERKGEGGDWRPGLREAAEPRSALGRPGPLKICANSRCSGGRRSLLSRHQPRVCGAPKCHKGAAWATFLSPESEEGETISRGWRSYFCGGTFGLCQIRWGPACRAWRLRAAPLPHWGCTAMQQAAGRARGAVWGLVFQSGKGKGGAFPGGA